MLLARPRRLTVTAYQHTPLTAPGRASSLIPDCAFHFTVAPGGVPGTGHVTNGGETGGTGGRDAIVVRFALSTPGRVSGTN